MVGNFRNRLVQYICYIKIYLDKDRYGLSSYLHNIYTHIDIYIYTYTNIHIQKHIHTYIYIYIHISILKIAFEHSTARWPG